MEKGVLSQEEGVPRTKKKILMVERKYLGLRKEYL